MNINLTPRWTEILPMHRELYEQVTHAIQPRAGTNANYQIVRDNFWKEVERMAQGADKFNDLVTYLRQSDTPNWDDEMFQNAIKIGRSLQEVERTTEREVV